MFDGELYPAVFDINVVSLLFIIIIELLIEFLEETLGDLRPF